MRRLIAFPCAGETLLGTLDDAPGRTGLLIVSGGNEIRIGAHRGMALLAQKFAARGVPVFRFDRRGVGDSTGTNGGFRSSGPDIGAAAATFSAEARIERLVALGNCDAATALALFGEAAGIDRLILANPWAVEPVDDLPPAAAIRSRYAAKLRDPREWLRLARGDVDLSKLISGLKRVSTTPAQVGELATDVADALRRWGDRATILLASGDATAIAYADAMARLGISPQTERLDSASHSFAREGDAEWLEEQLLAALDHHTHSP